MAGSSEKTPQLLNIKQLAERLNVPLRTMHYWLRKDRCPIQHIDGTKPRKWLASDVDAFLNADNVASAAE